MAFKTPGIYFNEEDNTDFTNPTASINTTVAIIGFAKKGPIGIPIEIYTYSDYKNTFGTPIAGQYAGLAVRSVLSSGGVVLFTRVADETIASKSNIVIKNGKEAVDGKIIINKASDISVGTYGYKLGKAYAGTISTTSGNSKTLILKTPDEGKLKLSNMAKQFSESLEDTYGYESFSVPLKIQNSSFRSFKLKVNTGKTVKSVTENTTVEDIVRLESNITITEANNIRLDVTSDYDKIFISLEGEDKEIVAWNDSETPIVLSLVDSSEITDDGERYNFKFVKTNGNEITETTTEEVPEIKELGPYFVNVSGRDSGESGNVETLVNNLQSALEKTNSYQKIYILPKNLKFEEEGVYSSAKFKVERENTFLISYQIGKVTSSKRIKIKGQEGNEDSYFYSIEDLASVLSEEFEKDGIVVKWCFDIVDDGNEGKELVKDSEGNGLPYLLFVSKNGEDIDIKPVFTSDNKINDASLFVPVENGYDSNEDYAYSTGVNIDPSYADYEYVHADGTIGIDNGEVRNEDFNGFAGLYCFKKKTVSSINEAAPIDVSYDERTKELIFTVYEGDDDETSPVGTKVEILPTEFGSYLFDREEASDYEDSTGDLKYFYKDNIKAVGTKFASYVGEEALNMEVYLEDGQIKFSEAGNLSAGTLTSTVESSNVENLTEGAYADLKDLIGESIDYSDYKELGYTTAQACVVYKDGSSEVDPANGDIVVFTAREYGEGTNVGIRVYTTTSPLDGAKTHYIETVINGVTKETWEDVSYNPTSERYFKDLMNEEPENAGSKYIKVEVIKNNTDQEEVMLPDTATLTGSVNTPIYVGKPVNENSINRASTVDNEGNDTGKPLPITDYLSYDYSIGDNGVPEDSTDLFTEAMDTKTSGLSNKDLYAWHILITPDNISEEVQDSAINLCEFMEDAIYIADPPQGISRANVVKWHNGAYGRGSAIQSDYACTYWPWLKVYDSNESKYVWCMPSVLMAAQFCKVDKNYAPWYAPAGQTNGLISQAVDIETYPNKADRDEMYLDQNRVNPFLMQKNGSILAYGEKTLKRKNSTLTKIHTRRMLISLKHELRNSIKGFIFLPTMMENITKIRGIATSIMEKAKTGGGVSSYTVVCDESNNTTETLQQDILNLSIVCVPNGCIEQVEINFVLNKSAS